MELNDYLSLIPPMNHDQPRFKAFLSAILTQVMDLDALRRSLQTSFSLEDAEGAQLDILGRLTGVSRILPFEPTSTSRILSDEDFRLLIRAAILRAHWTGVTGDYRDFVDALFEAEYVTVSDNLDMSVTITAPDAFSDAAKEMLSAGLLIPVPPGVSLTCNFV